MVNGDGYENGNKINRSNLQKKKKNRQRKEKKNLQVPYTFLYISLPLFCTTTMPLF